MSDALDAALGRIAAARAGGFGLFVARHAEPGEGWLPAGDLARDDGPLDGLVDAMGRSAGTDLRQVGAEWLLEVLAWHGAALTAAAMMSGRWVPDLRPRNVLVGVEHGAVLGLALRGGVVREHVTERALARAAHDALVAHVEPVIDALVARRLRPRRALWRAAGDRVGQAFLWCAVAYDADARARRLAELMLHGSPLHVPLQSAVGDDGDPYHLRASCCLNHRVPGAELCVGCPLRRPRRRRSSAA
jgi:hypothetical protein